MNKILLALILGCSVSSVALAGGYQLQEYSAVNLGRAFGGAGIQGDDYSAIAFNPAGMMLKGTGGQLGGSMVAIRGHADGLLRTASTGAPATPEGKGKFKTNALLPHFFAQTKAGERVRIGAGVYVPFGLGTYYKKGWYGESHALNSEISVITSAVAASVKVTDELSVGASAFMEYLEARLTNNVYTKTFDSDMNADGWKPGYSLGVMYEPIKGTRLGVSYRSKVDHRIKGNHYVGPFTGECGTKLVLPEHILMSATQKLGDFDVSAIARWTRWKRFNTLNVHSTVAGATVEEDWRNTWTIGGGVDYHYTPNWTYRVGLAWDQGAVRRPANRTARVPDSNRIQASLGLSYTKNNWQFDVGYMHLFWKHCHSYNLNKTYLDAKYNVRTDILSAGVQYNF